MSYKAFEFSLKTEYVFAESAAAALKTQMERRKPSKVMLLALPFMAHIPTQVLEELGIPCEAIGSAKKLGHGVPAILDGAIIGRKI